MARAASGKGKIGKKRPDVLEVLSPQETVAVLRELLVRHPELLEEARRLAEALVANVDRCRVARELVAAVHGLGMEELVSHAGRHLHGYVTAEDAAWQLLEGAVEPLARELERLLSLGAEDAARAQCEGVLLGLHTLLVDHADNDVLQYVPDFLAETASTVMAAWLRAPGGPRQFAEDLLHDELYEWVELAGQVTRTLATTARR